MVILFVPNDKFRKNNVTKKDNSSHYKSLIGSILYLTSTRYGIMFAARLFFQIHARTKPSVI